jgi:hypothetical protein
MVSLSNHGRHHFLGVLLTLSEAGLAGRLKPLTGLA